jgi:hypothetical protein
VKEQPWGRWWLRPYEYTDWLLRKGVALKLGLSAGDVPETKNLYRASEVINSVIDDVV